jgi:hypothetical protein
VDAIAAEALATLTTAMTSLLPAPSDPGIPHSVMVLPVRITRTGLGGFVGIHPDPQGEVVGRRVSARVNVSVGAQNANGLDAAVSQVTQAVMLTGRDELAQLGIHRLSVLELGPRPEPQQGGPPAAARRDVAFDVIYEFLKLPDQAGGIIETIPLDIDATTASNDPRVLLRGPFIAQSLDLFEVLDDAAAGTAAPSAWTFDAAAEAIRQSSDIRGGSDTPNADKPGTYLVLRPSPLRPALRDFTIASEMLSSSQGGVGFVFRFVDSDNFYFALLDSRTGFRMFGKKVNGAFAALEDGGLDTNAGFTTNALMRVRLVAQGDAFTMLIDGATVLEGRDGEIAAAGRVGFMTRHCTGARFFDVMLVGL